MGCCRYEGLGSMGPYKGVMTAEFVSGLWVIRTIPLGIRSSGIVGGGDGLIEANFSSEIPPFSCSSNYSIHKKKSDLISKNCNVCQIKYFSLFLTSFFGSFLRVSRTHLRTLMTFNKIDQRI